jgi:hypothetical protein
MRNLRKVERDLGVEGIELRFTRVAEFDSAVVAGL